jgi:MFS family permease
MSNPRSLIAMGAFSTAGNTPLVVQPMVVGAMVDLLGLTERQAGIVASVELVGLTLGILVMILVMSSPPRIALAVFAVASIAAANLLTCFVSSFTWLLPTRFLSGIGAAAAFCLYLNMASSDDHPEHVFAIVNAISITYSGILTLLAPYLLHAGGLPGLLLALCLMTLLALLTIPWIIRYRPQSSRPTRTPRDTILARIKACTERYELERLERMLAIRDRLGDQTVGTFPVTVWRMGDAYMVSTTGEPYSRYQVALREQFSGSTVAVLNLTIGATNYLPEAEAYEKDNYPARVTEYATGCLEGVIRKTSAVLHRLERI